MEHLQRIAYLFHRYQSGVLTLKERTELMAFVRDEQYKEAVFLFIDQQMDTADVNGQLLSSPDPAMARMIFERIAQKTAVDLTTIKPVPRLHFLKTTWLRYAAAIVLFLGIGAYLWSLQRGQPPASPPSSTIVQRTTITPGRNGAVLTLANGQQMVLDSLQQGIIAQQEGAQVVLSDGKLAYAPAGAATGEIMYNTMTTPKGRQFHLQLPDGTRAWLNAASSITYPTTFTGKERQVSIAGEVYFEVAKNARMPFRVKVNEQVNIKVLGTHFNINAYPDEPAINTSLIEGAVHVTAWQRSQTLRPGQQAQVRADRTLALVKNADMDKVMAWRRGVFQFEKANLQEVMRQLARWYDIEVVYMGNVPDAEFEGMIGRDLNLPDVLEGLKKAGVNFRISERKLLVMP